MQESPIQDVFGRKLAGWTVAVGDTDGDLDNRVPGFLGKCFPFLIGRAIGDQWVKADLCPCKPLSRTSMPSALDESRLGSARVLNARC